MPSYADRGAVRHRANSTTALFWVLCAGRRHGASPPMTIPRLLIVIDDRAVVESIVSRDNLSIYGGAICSSCCWKRRAVHPPASIGSGSRRLVGLASGCRDLDDGRLFVVVGDLVGLETHDGAGGPTAAASAAAAMPSGRFATRKQVQRDPCRARFDGAAFPQSRCRTKICSIGSSKRSASRKASARLGLYSPRSR